MAARKNLVVLTVGDFVRIEADLGPLVPVAALCKLVGKTKQAVWGRIGRGSCPVVWVWGQAFVPVDYWSTVRRGAAAVKKESDR